MSKLNPRVRRRRPCTTSDAAGDPDGPCSRSAAYRCDWPGCEIEMCPRHAKLIRFGVHYCPEHAKA